MRYRPDPLASIRNEVGFRVCFVFEPWPQSRYDGKYRTKFLRLPPVRRIKSYAILANPIIPREWFLVPRFVIDEAVERIKDGTITGYRYDPKTAALVLAKSG